MFQEIASAISKLELEKCSAIGSKGCPCQLLGRSLASFGAQIPSRLSFHFDRQELRWTLKEWTLSQGPTASDRFRCHYREWQPYRCWMVWLLPSLRSKGLMNSKPPYLKRQSLKISGCLANSIKWRCACNHWPGRDRLLSTISQGAREYTD